MKKPRPHQIEAINDVVKGFKTNTRGKLIMACGTGKTLVANWVREKLGAECTLFMAPSIALLAQTLREWRENSVEPFEALAICSDASVADSGDVDDLPAAKVGTAVTTDYQYVAKFISSTGKRVVLCTYQSSEVLAEAMGLVRVPEFDLAFADEAHRTTGGSDRMFSTVTDGSKIRAAKRLFMTATPRLYFNDKKTNVVSMDNEDLYGPSFHTLDFAEAIKLGLLADYEVLVVGVSPEAEQEAERLLAANPRLKVADRTMTARKLAVNIAILRTVKERSLARIITFHSSCSKAAAAADFLPMLQDWLLEKYRTTTKLWAQTVNHTMDIEDRHTLLEQFKTLDGPGLLTNARCLGEGVDVPTVDAVVFMDAKKSKVDIVQTVGRAIRLSPGKKKAYIILPVIMLPGDSAEQINSKNFQPAIDVLNALRAHDSTLLEQLEHWKDRGSHGNRGQVGGDPGDGGRKIAFDIPGDCNKNIAGWFETRVLEQPRSWDEVFARASKHDVLSKTDKSWILRQLNKGESGALSKSRYAAVELLAKNHSITSENKRLESKLQELLEYCQRHGCLPHGRSRLYRFYDTLSATTSSTKFWSNAENRLKLDAVSSYPAQREVKWHAAARRHADEVDAFVARNGYRPPPTSSPEGEWLSDAQYKPGTRHLPEIRPPEWFRRMRALPTAQAAGVTPRQIKAENTAKQRLSELEAFCKRHGCLPGRRERKHRKFSRLLLLLVARYHQAPKTVIREGLERLRSKYPAHRFHKTKTRASNLPKESE